MSEKNVPSIEIRLLREQTEKLLDAFIDRYRFSSLGSLVRGIVHNVNGSIQILSMQMELLQGMLAKEGQAIQGPIHTKVEQCLGQVNRLKGMIDLLLQKGDHDDHDAPQTIVLNELLEEELSLLQHHLFFKHQVEVKKALQPKLPPLRGKYRDFSQGLSSLIHNAIEAMEGTESKKLTVATEAAEGLVQVRIGDTGCGIPKEIRPHLFQPFFTTKGGNHFGLGLFISRELLTPYGATFNSASREGETIFSVLFPLQAVPSRSLG